MTSPKVFIVTGASKGIGAAVTRHLLEQSHKVVVTARSAEPLEGIKKAYPGQVEYVAGDMTSAEAQAALGELRKTKGCVVWVSSGAALKPYTGWSAYGSSKAALNSLSSHLAFEEKDITSITVSPGRVDTDMQVQIRSSGQQSMDKAQYDTFIEAFEQGKLLKPEQPGNVIAKFVASPQRELSGKDLSWNSAELASYQE
ncbi:short-chain dehydrogenase/reductase [Metarhizium acridum CQMa 102]|uniref:Hydroxynaphthalene reductase-like protein Arp2 n=1 Tax=Metarhizium acridum (strain CQMa 102) TaxID=655827 RepID=E9EAJ5_METAQ|nr:short-chain dehydrogenase/reductase [Metarhizium acridum CQMa 102]EFY87104.1 short-chain dehydrogenase/reductase [Metarhizium acridum CQMa 102]